MYGLHTIVLLVFFYETLGVCRMCAYIKNMSVNVIKLIVGSADIEEYAQWQARQEMDYEDAPNGRAVPCLTRFMPKRADEILKSGGSLYRVLKSRVVCRQKICGFEMVKTAHKGTMCAIMLEPEIITTVNAPQRPFRPRHASAAS